MQLLALLLPALAFVVLTGCEPAERITASQYNAAKWEEAIKNPSLTEQAFTRLYAQAVAAKLKDAEVKITGSGELAVTHSDGSQSRVFLDNAWNDAQEHPADRPEVVRRYLNALHGVKGDASSVIRPQDTNTLVAVIRDDLFLRQVGESGLKTTNRIVFEPFVADLNVLYAIDREGAIQYLTEADRQKWNLAVPELRALAMTNLKRLLPELNRHGSEPLWMLVADGNYEASLLLADKLWDDQAEVVQGDIVAGVPVRDMLMFTGSRSPGGIRALREAVDQIHAKGSHRVSKTLLVRRHGRWETFSD